jgi:hypothetical protein
MSLPTAFLLQLMALAERLVAAQELQATALARMACLPDPDRLLKRLREEPTGLEIRGG